MRSFKVNKKGVSPVLGVLLMIGITVVLSGSVYLMSNSYIGDAGGEPEIVNVMVNIDANGVSEYGPEDQTVVHRYSGVSVEIISGTFDWSEYKFLVNSRRVFTVPTNAVSHGQIPDASMEPQPWNSGKSSAGEYQWFTENGYRDDFQPMRAGSTYNVKIVNIETNQLVWENDIEAHQ